LSWPWLDVGTIITETTSAVTGTAILQTSGTIAIIMMTTAEIPATITTIMASGNNRRRICGCFGTAG